MESKLKALKVADLRQILSKASVAVPQKANKQELITRLIASKDALKQYHAQYPGNSTDLPHQPVQDTESHTGNLTPSAPEPSQPPPANTEHVKSVPSQEPLASPPSEQPPSGDSELEKRKKRADRFGIPLVEQTINPTRAKKAIPAVGASKRLDNPDKLTARAQRFGITTQATPIDNSKRKRGAIATPLVEDVDPEEVERRKKRAERFGTVSKI